MDKQYILSCDGKEVFKGSYNDCFFWIHRNTSFSFNWALQHEGYSLEEILI